jgi:acetyl-CoA synthetase
MPTTEPVPAARPDTKPDPKLVFADPLDTPTPDDTPGAWGDRPEPPDDDLTRFLTEKPPHHI